MIGNFKGKQVQVASHLLQFDNGIHRYFCMLRIKQCLYSVSIYWENSFSYMLFLQFVQKSFHVSLALKYAQDKQKLQSV